jgi:hypothetical protein
MQYVWPFGLVISEVWMEDMKVGEGGSEEEVNDRQTEDKIERESKL